jgi:hypothetical protein
MNPEAEKYLVGIIVHIVLTIHIFLHMPDHIKQLFVFCMAFLICFIQFEVLSSFTFMIWIIGIFIHLTTSRNPTQEKMSEHQSVSPIV